VSWRRTRAILLKDLRDALRDGRLVIVLLLPLAVAAYFAATTDDKQARPTTSAVIVDPDGLGVAEQLTSLAERGVRVRTETVEDAVEARRIVDADRAAFALVVTAGQTGDAPVRAQVLLPVNATPTTRGVVALAPDAVARAAGREPAAVVRTRALPVSAEGAPAQVVDRRSLMIVVSIIMLTAFVALMLVPIQTAEELEVGTFGALRLAATGPEILAAKALSGILYGVSGLLIITGMTGLRPLDWTTYVAAAVLLLISMVGFGLLLGLTLGNSNQVNTYGGFLVVPVVFIAVAVLLVDDGIAAVLLDLIPFSAATELLLDSVTPGRPFDTGVLSWLVLLAWTAAAYAVLTRVAARRDF